MSKHFLILRDFVIPNLSMFKDYTAAQIQRVLDDPRAYNVEYLVEKTVAEMGGLVYTDSDHSDYSDGSDCKTGSIKPPFRGGNSCNVEISAVARKGQQSIAYKAGDLRVLIYNPHKNECRFYFVPKWWWMNNINFHSSTGVGRIKATYNKKTDRIEKWEQFRCATAQEWALMKSTSKQSRQPKNAKFLGSKILIGYTSFLKMT